MKKFKKVVSMVAATAIMGAVFSGCATNELQTQSNMSRSIFLNPVKKSLRIVYVDVKNTSGQEMYTLLPLLEKNLKARGYKLTDDPEMAQYVLMANVLFANDKKENNTAGGAVAGAAAGAGVASYNNNGAGGTILAGAAAGLIGGLIAKSFEDTIFQMVVDVNVREKSNQKVLTSTGGEVGQVEIKDGKRAGFMNSFAGKARNKNGGGTMDDQMTETSTQQYETNYIERRTKIFAEATKVDLKLEEALPILERKIASQIAGIF